MSNWVPCVDRKYPPWAPRVGVGEVRTVVVVDAVLLGVIVVVVVNAASFILLLPFASTDGVSPGDARKDAMECVSTRSLLIVSLSDANKQKRGARVTDRLQACTTTRNSTSEESLQLQYTCIYVYAIHTA